MNILNKKSNLLIVITVMAFTLMSCRGRMEGINSNLTSVSPKKLKIDQAAAKAYIPTLELHIKGTDPGSYQLAQNLGADIYAGYLMTPTPFLGNVNNVTYSFVDGWVNAVWDDPRNTLNAWLTMKKSGYAEQFPALYSVATICKVFAASRAADQFGPIPYSQYGESSTPPFDGLKTAYNAFFNDLEQAVKTLTKVLSETPNLNFASVDKSTYNGDYEQWIELANTLRLRLAIRISLVAPDKAQKEAEAAVHQQYGVLNLLDEPEDVTFGVAPPGANPIYTITNSWGDTRVNAMVTTILKGYNDPRLKKYALPANDPVLDGAIKGIRSGIVLPAKQVYEGYSKMKVQSGDNVMIMDAAESYFLKAEGALRGWNMGGTAEYFYKRGVRASFVENGLSISAANNYLQTTTTQIDYVDPKNSANNAPGLNNVPVKWDASASFQDKLARIIIQKWIAMFPDGPEAWAEVRRTGYPKVWPNMVNNSSSIPDGKFIRRYPYTTTFTNTAQKQVTKAVNKYLMARIMRTQGFGGM